MGDAIVLLVICCFCMVLSAVGGGVFYKYDCTNVSGISPKTDCICDYIDWCSSEKGQTCNASGDCVSASATPVVVPDTTTPPPPPPGRDYVAGPDVCKDINCSINEKNYGYNTYGFNTGYCFPEDGEATCKCYPGWSQSNASDTMGKCDTLDINWNLFEEDGTLKDLSASKVYMSPDDTPDTSKPGNKNLEPNLAGYHCPDGTYLDTESYFNSSGEPDEICKKCPYLKPATINTAKTERTNNDGILTVGSDTETVTDYTALMEVNCNPISGETNYVFSSHTPTPGNVSNAVTACTPDALCIGFQYDYKHVGANEYTLFKQVDLAKPIKCIPFPETDNRKMKFLIKNEHYWSDISDFPKSGNNIGINSCLGDTLAHYNGSNICAGAGGDFITHAVTNCMDPGTALTDYERQSLNDSTICENASATCKDVLRYIDNEMYDAIVGGNVEGVGDNVDAQHLRRGRYKINASGKIECNDDGNSSSLSSTNIPPSPSPSTSPSTSAGNYCIGNVTIPENEQCSTNYGNGSGKGPCVNGTCSTSDQDDFTCNCSGTDYLGSLCHIKTSDLCGKGGTLDNNVKTDINGKNGKNDPLFGYIFDDSNYKIKPIYNSSIYDVPLTAYAQTPIVRTNSNKTLGPKLDSREYPCTCSVDAADKTDRRGFTFLSGELEADYFCNSPDDTWTNSIGNDHGSVPGNTATSRFWYDPSIFNNENLSQENKNSKYYESLGNMKSIVNCGSVPFTEGATSAGDDKGYQSGYFLRVNHGEDPQCIPCYGEIDNPDQSHGLNTIDVSKYLGWTRGQYSGYSEPDHPDLLVKDGAGRIPSMKDIITDTSMDFKHTCKPAYPGYYGTLGHFSSETNGSWVKSTESTAGGERIVSSTGPTTRHVENDYIPREQFKIKAGITCPEGKEIAWAPEEFVTATQTNSDVDIDQCEIKYGIKPVDIPGIPDLYIRGDQTITVDHPPDTDNNYTCILTSGTADVTQANLDTWASCKGGSDHHGMLSLNKNIIFRFYETDSDNNWADSDIGPIHKSVKDARDKTIKNIIGFDLENPYHLVATLGITADEKEQTDYGGALIGEWPEGEGINFNSSSPQNSEKLGYNKTKLWGDCGGGGPYGNVGCGGKTAAGAYWKEA